MNAFVNRRVISCEQARKQACNQLRFNLYMCVNRRVKKLILI